MQADCAAGSFAIGVFPNGTVQCSLASSAETDPRWTGNWTNLQANCGTNAYAIGVFPNGTVECITNTAYNGTLVSIGILNNGSYLNPAETDPRWTGNWTNMQADCAAGSFAIGVFPNGTVQCSLASSAESDPRWTGNWTNVAFTNVHETFNENVTFVKNISVDGETYLAGSVGIGLPPDVSTPQALVVYAPDQAATFYANLSTGVLNGRAFMINAYDESFARVVFYSDGKLGWGPGNNVRDAFISRFSANTLRVSSDGGNGLAHLIVNGNMGIGTTTPSSLLELYGPGVAGNLTLSNSDTTLLAGDIIGEIGFKSYDTSTSGTKVKAYIRGVAESEFTGGDHRSKIEFGTATGTGDPTTRMTITGDGNVNLSADVNLTMNGGNKISSNVTCIKIQGPTSVLEVC
jgi:hypothetical protein